MISIIIYLIGVVCSYLVGKHDLKREFGKYTKRDKAVVILISLFSFIGFFVFLITRPFVSSDSDKPAKW